MQWELMTFSMSLEIRVEIPVLESNSTEPREVKSQYSDRQQQEDSQGLEILQRLRLFEAG